MYADGLKQALRRKKYGDGDGCDWEKLVGMGWVWGVQVVPVQLSSWNGTDRRTLLTRNAASQREVHTMSRIIPGSQLDC